ncbi:MAG: hypothetical protein HYT83_02925, partial [Candidatus Levybacteria bacterium]|nr:hypothetical protein [Candidatus Levybacteria bacterium]
GINNFLVNLPAYEKIKENAFFVSFQPVHNIFLLIAAETGIVGLTFFLWFLLKTFKKNQFQTSDFKFQILAMVLILGLFDHYFLTLQQGQLLFAFVLGFCWS